MSLSKLPSKRWRARVYSPRDGKLIPVSDVLGLPKGTTWETKGAAKSAREKARDLLAGRTERITLRDFWEMWTTDPRFSRPKETTNMYNRERTGPFVDRYGHLPLSSIGRTQVNEWTIGGRNVQRIPALRTMFSDALRYEYVERNPFAKLGYSKTRGNRDVKPPSVDEVWKLIDAASRIASPSFAGWLQVAAFTGMRPSEVDALRWDAVDFENGRILVREQWSRSGVMTLPKNGRRRRAPLTPPARAALESAARESEFCFVNFQRHHWRASSRQPHWNRIRTEVGYEGSLYLATRHFAGWYMINELHMTPEDVAVALGHTDGGYLIRNLYGHLDEDRALDRIVAAYERRSNVVPLRAVREESAWAT